MKKLRSMVVACMLIAQAATGQEAVTYLPTELSELLKITETPGHALYTSALMEVAEQYTKAGQKEEALKYLLVLSDNEKAPGISVLTEPAFQSLHGSGKWPKIEGNIVRRVKAQYPELDLSLTKAFSMIYDEDQQLRNSDADAQTVSAANVRHVVFLDSVTKKAGFPTEKILSDEGVDGVFVTIQHCTLEDQKRFFSIWQKQATAKTERLRLAYIEDRILETETGKQKYGTQFKVDNATGKLVMIPLMDKDKVDQLRKEVGLVPLKQYLELIGYKE